MKVILMKITSVLSLSLLALPCFAQIDLSSLYKQNDIHQLEPHDLILVDFWATWCGPCINASKQLEVTQKAFQDNLYIISVTNESVEALDAFMKTHTSLLAIGADRDGVTFANYKAGDVLPYSVLLNQSNQVVWKGNPSDLTYSMIQKFIRENKNTSIMSQNRISVEGYREVQNTWNERTFHIEGSSAQDDELIDDEQGVVFTGNFSTLYKKLFNLSRFQVDFDKDAYVTARIANYFLSSASQDELRDSLLTYIAFSCEEEKVKGEYYTLKVLHPEKLWDTHQIDWGGAVNTSLVSDADITLDNANTSQLAVQLSDVLNLPVIVLDKDAELHDWQFPNQFEDLIKEALLQSYGVQLLKEQGKYIYYHVHLK